MNYQELIEDYIADHQHFSSETLKARAYCLRRFFRENPDFSSRSCSTWFKNLKTKNGTPASQKTKKIYAQHLLAFAKFLLKKSIIKYSEYTSFEEVLKHFQVKTKSNRKALTQKEVSKIYSARESAFEYMLVFCAFRLGCRVSEIAALNREDFLLDEDPPRVQIPGAKGKTGSKKHRLMVLKPKDIELVKTWLDSRKESDPAFLGEPHEHRLSRRSIQYHFNKIVKRAEIGKIVTLHEDATRLV